MSEQVTVGRRHTIVVPKSIRSKVKLKEGQMVLVKVEEGKIVIEPLPEDPYRTLGEVIGEPYDEREDEKRAEEWLKKHARR